MDQDEAFYRNNLTHYYKARRTFSADLQPVGGVAFIKVGLEHVRAADDIRISYDFDRDGYKIEQSRITADYQSMEDWQEVAFIPAWGLDTRGDKE